MPQLVQHRQFAHFFLILHGYSVLSHLTGSCRKEQEMVWLDGHSHVVNKQPATGRKQWTLSFRKEMFSSSSPELLALCYVLCLVVPFHICVK